MVDDLKKALEGKFNSWNVANNSHAVKWVGVELPKKELNTFLAPSITPVDTIRETISSTQGIKEEVFFQVNVHVRSGSGTGDLNDIIDSLKTEFSEQKFTNVITETVNTLPILEVKGFVVSGIRVLAYTRGEYN